MTENVCMEYLMLEVMCCGVGSIHVISSFPTLTDLQEVLTLINQNENTPALTHNCQYCQIHLRMALPETRVAYI